mmetsp:Transcript_108509/g.188411  ORF Transcript_108509/g.188411 Transcript_108509/m.188411 type:complete len:731 (-) Transcript_108509:88-2280(-)
MVSVGLNLKPTNLPAQNLAFTNVCYAGPADVAQISGGQTSCYVDIKGCVFSLESHEKVQVGSIALNKVQREYAQVGLHQDIFVKAFIPPKAFELAACVLDVDFFQKPAADAQRVEIKSDDLEAVFRPRFATQIFAANQSIALDYNGALLKFKVQSCQPIDLDGKAREKVDKGVFGTQTDLEFRNGPSGKLHILSDKMVQRNIFTPDFNFEELGIGGLSKEFGTIFRRAFASRVFPPNVIRDLGLNHVRGMLLHGPPGTGKTLIARQIAKFLKAAEPKIVNGPEILNKYVGQSEENIRKLFEDAEKEYKQQGEASQLHIVIFDEIDAICKQRGAKSDSTGVSDSIVNQLLTKIDGVDALNNILLIGMTNRLDLIDSALLRPGRLEVHVEINLPDEQGRIEILNIHTKRMRETGHLDPRVSIAAIAAETKNYSGAELEGLVRNSQSFALNRKVNFKEISNTKDLGEIIITQEDFDAGLLESKPAFGLSMDSFEHCTPNGIIPYSAEFDSLMKTCLHLLEQVRSSKNTPLLSVLLEGGPGCGKTALAAHLALKSDYFYVRRIASEDYVGYSETAKVAAIQKVFEDAYKTPLSLIVLDDLERLMDYVNIGPRFSNVILQALFSLLKKQAPKSDRRLLVIGTTSDKAFMTESELIGAFNVTPPSIPLLSAPSDIKAVLQQSEGFTPQVIEDICASIPGKRIGIKRLLLVAEMAVTRQKPVTKEIFLECLHNVGVR